MKAKSINILIAENIPSLNKGEMTILGGMQQSLKCLGSVKLSMFSAAPEVDQPRYLDDLTVIDISHWKSRSKNKTLRKIFDVVHSLGGIASHLVFSLLYRVMGAKALKIMRGDLWKHYADCDLIIIGHDNTYGIMVGLTYLYYIYLPWFGRLIGKPVVFYGGSILKENRPLWLWKKAIRLSLRVMPMVSLRERITYERLGKHKLLNPRIAVTGDPAFLLEPVANSRVEEILQQEKLNNLESPLVGVTLTQNCARKSFRSLGPDGSYARHNEIMAAALDHLIARYRAHIVFLPHCIGLQPVDDDRIIARDVYDRCKNESSITLINTEYSAAELKGLIGRCSLFIGERIHSTINALSMQVPALVLVSKDDQRQDIIRMLEQEPALYYTHELDLQGLIDRIDRTWSNRQAIKNELHAQVPVIKAKAQKNGEILKNILKQYKIASPA